MSLPLVVLVATAVVMAMELVRTTGPLLDRTYVEEGLTTVITVAVLTYAAPGLVLAVTAAATFAMRPTRTLLGVVGLAVVLAVLRLGIQATTATTRYWLGLAAAAVALALVVLSTGVLAARDRGGAIAAGAVAIGVAAGMSLHLVVGMWDASWRHSLMGWSLSVAMVAVLVGSAWLAARDVHAYPDRSPRRVWATGPYLSLALVIFGSVPFAASQSDLPAVVAGPVLALALLMAAWLAQRGGADRRSGLLSIGAPAATVLLTWAALRLPAVLPAADVLVLLVLVSLAVAATLTLAAAVEPLPPQPDQRAVKVLNVRLVVAGTVTGLGVIVPVLVYLVGYDTPLGFPNYLAMLAAAALLTLGGLHRSYIRRAGSVSDLKPALAAATALLFVGTAVAAGTPLARPATYLDSSTPTAAGSVRIMAWNLHYGVGEIGSLELEELARTIERHQPDVVLLNEVARGWLIGGGSDMATWLSERLGGHLAFAPAADRQFGNAILSRWPLNDVQVKALPPGDAAPQRRSAVAATVDTGAGELTTVAVHLQVSRSNAPARILELETLLPWLDSLPSEAIVLGGDMNFRVGDEEEGIILDAGYRSALDEVGDPGSTTHPSSGPTVRYDWLFARGVEFTRASVLDEEKASDHLPVVVTLVP